MSAHAPSLGLFAGLGLELEYMIVQAESLSVLPVADEVLRDETGAYCGQSERGELAWSNELALHVLEFKTKGPVTTLRGLPALVRADVRRVNQLLEPWGGCLMPTGMHPWMDPQRETRLWPHDYNAVYAAFDRVFGCQGHGWSNLQSIHLNLPFATEAEFARLHAAIRLILPLLPALAASSPLQDGRVTGWLDNRLRVYRTNCARIPSITGQVVPEPVFTPADYQRDILQKIYRDIAPFDPEGLLQEEWLNARGAIARFERNTIEIRLLDTQETAEADLAIAAAVVAVLQCLVAEQWTDLAFQQSLPTSALSSILLATMREADGAVISDRVFLRAFGLEGLPAATAGEVWHHLLDQVMPAGSATASTWSPALAILRNQGCLARRILRATGPHPNRAQMQEVYRELCRCLAAGEMLGAGLVQARSTEPALEFGPLEVSSVWPNAESERRAGRLIGAFPPHPDPLPPGEGESTSARARTETCLLGEAMAKHAPSPGGRGSG